MALSDETAWRDLASKLIDANDPDIYARILERAHSKVDKRAKSILTAHGIEPESISGFVSRCVQAGRLLAKELPEHDLTEANRLRNLIAHEEVSPPRDRAFEILATFRRVDELLRGVAELHTKAKKRHLPPDPSTWDDDVLYYIRNPWEQEFRPVRESARNRAVPSMDKMGHCGFKPAPSPTTIPVTTSIVDHGQLSQSTELANKEPTRRLPAKRPTVHNDGDNRNAQQPSAKSRWIVGIVTLSVMIIMVGWLLSSAVAGGYAGAAMPAADVFARIAWCSVGVVFGLVAGVVLMIVLVLASILSLIAIICATIGACLIGFVGAAVGLLSGGLAGILTGAKIGAIIGAVLGLGLAILVVAGVLASLTSES